MFKNTVTDFGLRTDFIGAVNNADMRDWLEQTKADIQDLSKSKFAILIDFRRCAYLGASAKKTFDQARKVFYHMGMRRSSLIFAEPQMAKGFKHVAKNQGFHTFERYLDSTNSRCEKLAMEWLLRGEDPDLIEDEQQTGCRRQ